MTATPPLDRPVTPFPRLRPPFRHACEVRSWHYPVTSEGTGRLQVWVTLHGYLAVLTHQAGTSPADASREIHGTLRPLFPEGDLIILEHVPGDEDGTYPEHWNQLTVTPDDRKHERRVWPVPVTHPDYGPFSAWAQASATMIGIPPEARP